ncbi:MAG: Hpt domain-containing protein [Pseudomonadota bacterium]|nr:Hpt domain-containing protein [Pseudomonadota bacterium]
MNSNHPHIDLDHGVKVIGDMNNAKKVLTLFIEKLPTYESDIIKFRKSENWEQLKETMHSLKGATCYSSTPALHHCFSELNSLLSNIIIEKPSDSDILSIDHLLDAAYLNIAGTITAFNRLQ